MSNSNSNSIFNTSEVSSFNDFFPLSTKININNRLSLNSPIINKKKQNILHKFLNNSNSIIKIENNELNVPNKKKRISMCNYLNLNISSNNPSTFETSLSNSYFDMKSPQIKNLNISNTPKNKILVHIRPKSDNNKIKLDIILGYAYILSKNNQNRKKIEKFIFKSQKKFDERMEKFKENNEENISEQEKINKNMNLEIKKEIKSKTIIFHKFEIMMSIFILIIYYLIKTKKKERAKIIYLLIIKQNMRHFKYLEKIINFQDLIDDTNAKQKLQVYRYANIILLKIYSNYMKYGFLFNLSFYGNLFNKMYLKLSQKYYLYSLELHKIKYWQLEHLKFTKYLFASLNFNSAYFSVANYSSMKIPIYLYSTALNIYNSFDEHHYDPNDKHLILNTKYNKSLLLYMNGENDEAINTLKELKINLFNFIEDKFQEGTINKKIKNGSFLTPALSEQISEKTCEKKENLNKKISVSFSKIFSRIVQNKTIKNKNQQLTNINLKLEPFFISNTPINIENFVIEYLNLCGISSQRDNIKHKSTYNFVRKLEKASSDKKNSLKELNLIDKNNQSNIPKIFKLPFLIKSELLIAEIELDKKHYRATYTFTNHALAIISIFRKVDNNYLLNKYKDEQKFIKEFLSIIDNSNIITESDSEENEEEEEKEKKKDTKVIKTLKNIEYRKQIEFQERVNVNKKVLKELEKFFVFFMTLSVYQIKILNETQPKAEIKDYLPILFHNQFKDCLSLRQSIALENLDVMSLSRYMILKEPNNLILPTNLNISTVYLERPELFKINNNLEKLKRKEEILSEKKAKKIFKKIIKSIDNKNSIINKLNKNYNLAIKIIKNLNMIEIKKIIQNPESLIKSIDEYIKKYKKQSDFNFRGFKRQKSQVINNNIFFLGSKDTKKLELNPDFILKKEVEKYNHKSLPKDFNKSSHKNLNEKINLKARNSCDKIDFFSRNNLLFKENKEKNKDLDSFTSNYRLSIRESNN